MLCKEREPLQWYRPLHLHLIKICKRQIGVDLTCSTVTEKTHDHDVEFE